MVHKFKKIRRSGWNRKAKGSYRANHVEDAESDADHSYGGIFLSLFIGPVLGLDVEKLLIMFLLHDFPEAPCGDKITALEKDPEKRRQLEEEKEDLEIQAMWEMLSVLDKETQLKIFGYYLEYIERETLEAKIAYQIDKIETILQSYYYEKDGEQVSALEFITSYEERIHEPLLQEVISLIKQKIGGGSLDGR